MPRGDGTGPWGGGPMTGRAAGYCAGNTVPGYMSPGGGLGRFGGWGGGWRGGGGRGYRNVYYATGLTGWQRGVRAPGGWGGYGWSVAPAVPYGAGITREQEVAGLQAQAENLEQTLSDIRERLSKLESEEQ